MTGFFTALSPVIFSICSVIIGVVVVYLRSKGGYF